MKVELTGGATAQPPCPLAYFSSALTACVMTKIRAFAKCLNVPVVAFTVNTRCHWKAQQTGTEPYVSAPVAFTVDVDMPGDVSDADKLRVLAAAERGCFVA